MHGFSIYGLGIDCFEERVEETLVQTMLEETVVSRLAQRATSHPDRTALIGEDASVSYRELQVLVASTKRVLLAKGVGPATRVGILLPRSIDTVVTIFAALSCGAAYVPLDRTQPTDRLITMVHDAQISAVVVDTTTSVGRIAKQALTRERPEVAIISPDILRSARRIADNSGRYPRSDTTAFANTTPLAGTSDCADTNDRATKTVSSGIEAETLAYVIFTSGSTGRPKGVQISHGNLRALLDSWTDVMGDDQHISLLSSALSFDASVCELFWPLWHGSTLVVCPDHEVTTETTTKHSAQSVSWNIPIGEVMRKHHVTHLQCTPTRAVLLLANRSDRDALAEVKHLVIGGEALNQALANELCALGIPRITNAYGPTEATVWASTFEVKKDLTDHGIVAIGQPLINVQIDVVDEFDRSLPDGETGALILSGPQVSAGYVGQPEQTSERFGSVSGHKGMWYRTGDLASRRVVGTKSIFDFHGRSDSQVKLRGHRIELGEIEACLDEHTSIQHSIALLYPGVVDEIVATVVAVKGLDFCVDAVNSHVRASLPEVMIPSHYVELDALPLTSSGKVDRVALAASLASRLSSKLTTSVIEEPRVRQKQVAALEEHLRRVDIEGELVNVISDFNVVLNKPSANADSNFFELGGHSLHAVEIVTRMHARTGTRLPLDALLESPTPRGLVRYLERGGQSSRTLVRFGLTGASVLYLIHGAGGTVMGFRRLAVALSPQIEVIGIQAAGVDDGTLPDTDLSAMVSRYAAQIRKHYSENPSRHISIGGYSDGGIIALHVAQNLVDTTPTLPLQSVVLLDAVTPSAPPVGVKEKIKNVRQKAAQRGAFPITSFMKSLAIGWKRRRDYDVEGVAAQKTLGYVNIYDHIHHVVTLAGPPPHVPLPGLLIRTLHNSPTSSFDYTFALTRTVSLNEAWIEGKHDEILFPEHIAAVSASIADFIG